MELVQTFNTTLNDFITNLKRCYPEETSVLNKIDMLQDTRPLQKFMKCVGTNMDKISKMDKGSCNIAKTRGIQQKKLLIMSVPKRNNTYLAKIMLKYL